MKKILTIIKLIFAFLLLQGATLNSNAKTIHTIGDSTMATYDESTTDKRGWGMMFQQFFTADVTINNRAKSGASSKSFYEESPYWATVKTQIVSGDYVFIQFAHNDEKNGGLDGDTVRKYTDPNADYRGTTAQGTYKKYLRLYIDESIALGATPVLVTPMCRKYFSGGAITRKGRHDLGENFSVGESDHTYDYVYAMKEVATEKGVELIDLTELTKDLFVSYGDAACTELLFCTDDSTHPNALGGTLVARLCAQAMSNQGILDQYVNASSDLLINPTNCDFGDAYVGQILTKELTISGFDLDPASGIYTLSVTEGFSIAATKTDQFGASITMDYANGNLDFSRFYIAASQSSPGLSEGTLTVTDGTNSKYVPLKANFIQLTGGTEVNVTWELSANSDYVLTGPAQVVDEIWSSMYVQRYAIPNSNTLTESTKWDVTQKMQRNLIEGDAWPAGEIDEVSTRYMQFGITANEGTDLNIDSIGMFVAGAGGNGMRCRISYSTNNFADYSVIHEFSSMVANTVYEVSALPIVRLSSGETLLVRVYPWYSSAASGKTICLGDVTIHGMASTATALDDEKKSQLTCKYIGDYIVIKNAPANCDVVIYNLSGNKVHHTFNQDAGLINIKAPTSKGVYICTINSLEGIQSMKFLVP